MKFVSLTLISQELKWLPTMLEGLVGLDRCLLLANAKPWCGEKKNRGYEIYQIVKNYPNTFLFQQNWYLNTNDRNKISQLEGTVRNFGLDLLQDYDYVFIVDSDEIYLKDDIEKLKQVIMETKKDVYFSEGFEVLWKTPEYKIFPPEGHKPVICVNPKRVKFSNARNIIMEGKEICYVPKDIALCYHFSYVRNDEEVLYKIKNQAHLVPFIDTWYQNKWVEWTPEMEDLHPITPSEFKKAVKFELPEEIKCRLPL